MTAIYAHNECKRIVLEISSQTRTRIQQFAQGSAGFKDSLSLGLEIYAFKISHTLRLLINIRRYNSPSRKKQRYKMLR